MADSSTEPVVKSSTDDTPHQINEIVEKCRKACNSYREFSDELTALVKDQDSIFQQHQDLLEEAYVELKDVAEICCEAQELLVGHVQACCTKLQHVKVLGADVRAMKSDVASLHALLKTCLKQQEAEG